MQNKKTWTVYIAQDPINVKLYVGLTSIKLNNRTAVHKSAAKRGMKMAFYDHVRVYGFDQFEWSAVHSCDSLADGFAAEETITIFLKNLLGDECVLNTVNGSGRGKTLKCPSEGFLAMNRKGSESPHYNHKIYEFVHPVHGVMSCTMYELRTKYNLCDSHLSSVCNGKRGNVGGWTVPASGWTPKFVPEKLEFVHPTHGTIICTAAELSEAYKVAESSIAHMRGGRRKTAAGWTVKKEAA